MDNVIFRTSLLRGPKGDRGETGAPDSVPKDGVIAYDGDDLPEGYVEIEELDVYGDLMTEMASLDARLDIVESLPEGSTTMDAELVDIRYGANGKTYQTAGKAVRGQIDEVNENMEWYQEKDRELIDNATLTGQASGEIASFDMGGDAPLKECVIQIEPEQDLHGYDFPWAGGAGKNKFGFVASDFATATVIGLAKYIAVDFPPGTYTASSNCPTGYLWVGDVDSWGSNRVYAGISRTFTLTEGRLLYIGVNKDDVEGSLSYLNQIEEGNTATPFAPYSNVCPINGYYQSEIDAVGKNLANPDLLIVGFTDPATRKFNNSVNAQTQLIETKGLSTISISCTNGNRCNVAYYNEIPTAGSDAETEVTSYGNVPCSFTVNTAYKYVAIQLAYDTGGANVSNVMAEKGSTATAYEPYNRKTTPVPFSNKNLLPSHLKYDSFDFWSGAQALKEINPSDTNKHWFGDEYDMDGCYVVIETEEDKDTIKEIRISRSEADPGNNLTFYLYNAGTGLYEFDQAVDLTVGAETDTSLFVDVATFDGETRHDALSHQGAVVPLPDNNMQQVAIVINGSWSGQITLKPMISPHSDTDKTFMPYYNGLQLSGERVYKGYVDPVNMRLTVTHTMIILDGSQTPLNANWTPTENTVGWIFDYNDTENKTVPYNVVPDLKSDKYKALSYNQIYNQDNVGVAVYNATSIGLIVRQSDTTLNTAQAVKTYLAQNPIEVFYELAAPRTYGINYTELKSLLGVNNISADTGEIAITFRKDANLVINSLIARIEALEGGNS